MKLATPALFRRSTIWMEAHDNHVGMRTRSGRTMTPPSRFLGVTKIPEGNLMSKKREEAISAELKQLFEDLQHFTLS
jgi:hypothetical protein